MPHPNAPTTAPPPKLGDVVKSLEAIRDRLPETAEQRFAGRLGSIDAQLREIERRTARLENTPPSSDQELPFQLPRGSTIPEIVRRVHEAYAVLDGQMQQLSRFVAQQHQGRQKDQEVLSGEIRKQVGAAVERVVAELLGNVARLEGRVGEVVSSSSPTPEPARRSWWAFWRRNRGETPAPPAP